MNWYIHCIRNYANFNGRARRTEYWMFVLFNVLFAIAAAVLDVLLNINFKPLPYGMIYVLYALFSFIPNLAVFARRMHDVGKSGWMFFVALIPFVGAIWLLVLLLTDSQPDENEYGFNPKGQFENFLEEGKQPNYTPQQTSKSTDNIIFIVVLWMLLSQVFYFAISKISFEYYSTGWFKVVQIFSTVIWSAIPIVLATQIRNKSIQTIVFVLAGLHAIIDLYKLITDVFTWLF